MSRATRIAERMKKRMPWANAERLTAITEDPNLAGVDTAEVLAYLVIELVAQVAERAGLVPATDPEEPR